MSPVFGNNYHYSMLPWHIFYCEKIFSGPHLPKKKQTEKNQIEFTVHCVINSPRLTLTRDASCQILEGHIFFVRLLLCLPPLTGFLLLNTVGGHLFTCLSLAVEFSVSNWVVCIKQCRGQPILKMWWLLKMSSWKWSEQTETLSWGICSLKSRLIPWFAS